MKFQFGGRNASQATPQEPGSKDETKSNLVSIEMNGKFSQQKNLEGQGNKPEQKRREKSNQVQIPGMGLLQYLHLPPLSAILPMLYPVRSITIFLQLGQYVLSAE